MPDRRADPFGFEQLFGWLKPNPQLGNATERAMGSLGQVGQLLSETTQAVMKKQSEMLSESMSSMAASVQELPRLRTPQDLFKIQTAALRTGVEATVNNMRDVTMMWQRCSSGMADLWLQALASNGEAAPPEHPPVPVRKAAE